jgi:surfeit locus 1 family protein
VRRIVLFVIAATVTIVCVRLGFWQLDRLDQRRTLNAAIGAGLSAAPAPLGDLLAASGGSEDPTYRRTVTTGRYVAQDELLLYGRALEGRPGDHVLTPLVLADGSSVLVDRGWIPFEPERDAPVTGSAAAPTGDVRIEGVLLPSEEAGAFAGEDPAARVRAVNVGEIAERVASLEPAPVYLLLQDQTPAQPQGLPAPAPPPAPSEGPHLSYAIQWFTFATIAVVGYGVLLRRDLRGEHVPEVVSEEGSGEEG